MFKFPKTTDTLTYVGEHSTILTFLQHVLQHIPSTCLWPDFHSGRWMGMVVELRAGRLPGHCVSKFASVTPLDILTETSGPFPSTLVATNTETLQMLGRLQPKQVKTRSFGLLTAKGANYCTRRRLQAVKRQRTTHQTAFRLHWWVGGARHSQHVVMSENNNWLWRCAWFPHLWWGAIRLLISCLQLTFTDFTQSVVAFFFLHSTAVKALLCSHWMNACINLHFVVW